MGKNPANDAWDKFRAQRNARNADSKRRKPITEPEPSRKPGGWTEHIAILKRGGWSIVEIREMPFSQFEEQIEAIQRHESHAMADLILAVNQGTNGEPDKVNKLLRQLRAA